MCSKTKLNFGSPEELERKRITEIKALTYLERLERLMIIIEVSYKLKEAKKVILKTAK